MTSNPATSSAETESPTTSAPSTTSDTGEPPIDGCPDPLPSGWILCEGFEAIDDPATHFAVWAPTESRFFIDATQAHAGIASLAVQHDNEYYSGSAWIRFGAGPGMARYSPEARFTELTGSPPPAGLERAPAPSAGVMTRDDAAMAAMDAPDVRSARAIGRALERAG